MKLFAAAAAVALAASLAALPADNPTFDAKHKSWGYEGDGGNQLPDVPVTESGQPLYADGIRLVGRTNPHSGGRTGGHANKRHGGGGRNHPNDVILCVVGAASCEGVVTVQPVRVRSARGKPSSMRPGGRGGCCKIKKNF